jgi:hypothetical protein
VPVSVRDVVCILFILAPSSLRSLCSHAQQHYSVACQSRTSAIHDLKLLIFDEDNGSIMCSLVKIAQFGWEEAGRVSLP